jgi:hypothetical protein
LPHAISLVVEIVIGTGVFLKAAVMTQEVGSPYWVLAAWIAAGLYSLAGALSLAELGAMMPHAGGQYVYLREAYGDMPAFFFSWNTFTVGAASLAAYGAAFATFLSAVVPPGGAWVERTIFTDRAPAFGRTGARVVGHVVHHLWMSFRFSWIFRSVNQCGHLCEPLLLGIIDCSSLRSAANPAKGLAAIPHSRLSRRACFLYRRIPVVDLQHVANEPNRGGGLPGDFDPWFALVFRLSIQNYGQSACGSCRQVGLIQLEFLWATAARRKL